MSKPKNSVIQLDQFVPYRMVRLASNMSASLAEIYKREFNITVAQWRVLAQLAEHKTLLAKDIGCLTSMDKSKVSRAVTSLEHRGCLQKQFDENDQRAALLSLTQAGLSLYKQVVPQALAWEKRMIGVLEASEYQSLMRVLDKLDQQLL